MTEPSQPVVRQPLQGEVVDERAQARDRTLALLDFTSFVMDRLWQVPGTKVRVGLNSVLLFLPILGDFVPSAISFGILLVALSNYKVPRIVATRMLINSLLDTSIGWIPIVGDLFDVYFKADTRNVRLLQEYAGRGGDQPAPSTWRHWLFVGGLLLGLAVVLLLIILGAMLLMQWVVHLIRGT